MSLRAGTHPSRNRAGRSPALRRSSIARQAKLARKRLLNDLRTTNDRVAPELSYLTVSVFLADEEPEYFALPEYVATRW